MSKRDIPAVSMISKEFVELDNKFIKCLKCSRIYKFNEGYYRRLKTICSVPQITEYKCNKCSKIFQYRCRLESHSKLCSGEKKLKEKVSSTQNKKKESHSNSFDFISEGLVSFYEFPEEVNFLPSFVSTTEVDEVVASLCDSVEYNLLNHDHDHDVDLVVEQDERSSNHRKPIEEIINNLKKKKDEYIPSKWATYKKRSRDLQVMDLSRNLNVNIGIIEDKTENKEFVYKGHLSSIFIKQLKKLYADLKAPIFYEFICQHFCEYINEEKFLDWIAKKIGILPYRFKTTLQFW